MVTEAKENEAEDKEHEKKNAARLNLDRYIYEVETKLEQKKSLIKDKLTQDEIDELNEKVNTYKTWQEESGIEATREELETQHKEFEGLISPLLTKAFGVQVNQKFEPSDETDDLDDL